METSARVYAIGDVTVFPPGARGVDALVARECDRRHATMDYSAIPNASTDPRSPAWACPSPKPGQGRAVKVGRFNFASLGKAMCIGETAGMAKVVADARTDQVLGVGIVGPHTTDIIAEGVLAVRHGLTAAQVAEAVHAHPTLSEAMGEAMHDVHGQAIHKARLRAS
jgi:dihydrolipoamide dehydrogenase